MSDFVRFKVKFSSNDEVEELGVMDSIFKKEFISSIYEINYNDEKHIIMAFIEYSTKGEKIKILANYEILDETMDTIMSKLEEGTNEL